MNAQQFTILKFALVGLVLVGGFVLAGVGKMDPSEMYKQDATLIAALVVALGISSGGNAAASAIAAHTRMMALLQPGHSADDVRGKP